MKITHLTLQTAHLSEAREFYAGALGLPVARRSTTALTLRIGATLLTFQQAPAGWQGFYHFAFNVPPERFQRARAWMAAVSPLLEDADGRDIFAFRAWNADACYFCDPAGNVGELIARHDLPRGLPGDVLCVSEIGVVVDDVAHWSRRLTREATLGVYRETSDDAFAALGSAEGLFILVPPGRKWYPDTDKAAVVAPLTINFLDEAGVARQFAGPPYQLTCG